MGGQLTIKAPNARVPQGGCRRTIWRTGSTTCSTTRSIPGLAAHGGMVTLVRRSSRTAWRCLQFGGGCQGCAAVDITLKNSVENALCWIRFPS